MVARGGPTQYQANSFNVVADGLKCICGVGVVLLAASQLPDCQSVYTPVIHHLITPTEFHLRFFTHSSPDRRLALSPHLP